MLGGSQRGHQSSAHRAASGRFRLGPIVVLIVLALAIPSQAGATAPLPTQLVLIGSKPVAAPQRGATIKCDPALGGCTTFSPSASAVYPSGFRAPEHGGIVFVAIGHEPIDNYSFRPVLARPAGTVLRIEAVLGVQTPFGVGPWGTVGPGAGQIGVYPSPPTPGSFAVWDQPGYEVKKGELVGISAAGPVGPSLEADPGRDSVAFKPALESGALAAPGPLNVLKDLSLEVQVAIEKAAALRAHSAWAFPNPVTGFRQGSAFRLLAIAQNTSSKAAARDVIGEVDLAGKPFKGLPKLGPPCDAYSCLNLGTIPAVGQPKAKRPFAWGWTLVKPPQRGKGRIDVLFESQTIENDQSTLANNGGSFRLTFKRERRPAGRPPGCQRLRLGTPRPDTLNGSRRSDTLVGLQANDTLRGRGAGDCIVGSAGADLMRADAGNDVLLGDDPATFKLGKPGRDRIDAGPGRDYVDAGPANDSVVSKDGETDIVDCGPGRRDRVEADRKDRLTGCEIRVF